MKLTRQCGGVCGDNVISCDNHEEGGLRKCLKIAFMGMLAPQNYNFTSAFTEINPV